MISAFLKGNPELIIDCHLQMLWLFPGSLSLADQLHPCPPTPEPSNHCLPSLTSWQIDGETVGDFILGGSKIAADGDCSNESKRRLLLGRKVMTNLDSILKSRDITLPTKIRLLKAMVFPVVMYGCESWTIKN